MKEPKKEQKKERSRRLSAIPDVSAPCIELSGNRELLIEGSKGVLEYSPETVRVNTAVMIVEAEGRNLNLRCISDTALIIDGFLTSLRFKV